MPSLRVLRRTFKRDFTAALLYLKLLLFMRKCSILNQSVADLFAKTLAKNRNKVCFVYEGEEWTFEKVNVLSNKIANAFLSEGYKKGDEVALIMENCPEYVCIWLGLSKIGVVSALINTNQREDALGHSINILDTKGIIFGRNFSDVVKNGIPFLDKKDTIQYYSYSRENSAVDPLTFPSKSLNSLLNDASPREINLRDEKVNFTDKLFYIYTSGTTGLPKAAVIRNSRFIAISCGGKFMNQISDSEIFYNPLPLYHSAGGILFLGIVLCHGGKMILRKKFSASNFWREVTINKATVSQYIGEICRYLLNQPKSPYETQHHLRLFLGNGLRANVWQEFQERFRIEKIVEIYGATEGNANLVNIFGKVGAVGFIPRLCEKLYPVYLMRVNPETGDLLRNDEGLCIRCKPGEPGEMIGKIIHNNPYNSFDGYANKADTKRKIARDCFKHGDTVFCSGDILVMDEDGYVFFLDRTGDTFRWKGENVSTGEVENVISKSFGHIACVVYGVEVPNTEGRAGMAAIQIDDINLNLNELYQEVVKKLPSYAVPMFIRVSPSLESTGTYKLRKVSLQKEGFNPEEISDPLYFLDHKQKTYVPFTKELYSDITSGKLKL